jgi:hypothetical protein
MLETATLRESLDGRNKELATSLYQYDAACRVIARLVKERDEARAGMAAAPVGSGGKRSAGDAMEVDGEAGGKKAKGGLTQQVLDQMAETAQTLSKSRRKRVASAQLASQEALGGYALRETLPLHKSSSPGISAVALHPGRPGEVFATAGADKTGVVYDRAAGKKTAELKGHTKELTDIKCVARARSHAPGCAVRARAHARCHPFPRPGLQAPPARCSLPRWTRLCACGRPTPPATAPTAAPQPSASTPPASLPSLCTPPPRSQSPPHRTAPGPSWTSPPHSAWPT